MKMTIYYDFEQEKWFHDNDSSYTFGKNAISLPFSEARRSCLSFSVVKKGRQLGPLIGIVISNSAVKQLLKGHKRSFEQIHQELKSLGGVCIVFTAENVQTNEIHGYVFSDDKKEWVRVKAPLPDIVYNRIKTRKEERTTESRHFFQFLQQNNIPYFNPSFFTKWQLYQILNSNKILRPYLPATLRISSFNDVITMLNAYGHIYMKPNEGHKGKGIFTLQLNGEQRTVVFSNMKHKRTFENITTLFELYNLDEYIAQQAIQSDTINGKRYDLRILAHYQNNSFVISGIGVRQSIAQEITTHIPNGGRLIPYEFIKDKNDESLLRHIVVQCGKTLSAHLGLIGEFSLDLGRTPDGHYYIYELNSKPMIFDEPEIQQQGTKNLIRAFHELSGFVQA
ncbi:YheC/D-like protein [Anoxybacillus vitaminiphilus]|uniref:YheC/D-like protein n=1 Tax=Paranoxybacillus vitaminiphilus TaxID=581036 RepID=A0A327YMI3_9BACL|nr:YheC/YheD family protein [Anoxybacillus vitaminiphilus]RAK19459.1 YheC/D-like protein [Anoxybacillus vitaminiphilus]